MRLSDYQGEDALDLLADIMEPAIEIMADPEVKEAYKSGTTRIGFIKVIIKGHKKSIIEIMAAIDGVPVEEYKVNFFTLPKKLMELLEEPEIMSFFASQSQEILENVSGSAMESIEAEEI